jgi:hypothetical protein
MRDAGGVDRRDGEQAGADRMGGAPKWSGLQSDSPRYTGINRRNKRLPPATDSTSRRWGENVALEHGTLVSCAFRLG